MSSVYKQPHLQQPVLKCLPRCLRQITGLALLGGVVTSLSAVSLVQAQEAAPKRGSAALLEEVMVTARKREEGMQDVPLSISAYGSDQLEALKVRDLSNLSVGMPNVALDDAGSAKGYANFSIRGLGINSSILSIDPTVGVFVDGVYMGVNAGMVFDVFDLERVEVLRGPQGTLFGKNVTGGAILMTTKKPGDRLEATVRTAIDGGFNGGGFNKYIMGTVGGPMGDKFGGKITAYYNDDDGWFENKFTGDDFGAVEQTMFRTTGVFKPTDGTELILRWEHAENDSDGPASQSHMNGDGLPGAGWDRDSFEFAIDEEGFYNTETDFVSFEVNQDVGFGNGTITNIFGWRTYDAESRGDIDGLTVSNFHSDTWTETEQFSNELRYSGRFADKASVTTGLYYFTNDIDYHERRSLLSSLVPPSLAPYIRYDGGGFYSVETWAAFGAVDYDFTDALTLNAGLRYTYEEKEVKVATLNSAANRSGFNFGGGPGCNLISPAPGEGNCTIDFVDDESWDSWSPKLGLTYNLSDQARIYGHWTRSFRSGGYNLRNTSADPTVTPGPFDEETVDNYEIGFKSEYSRGRFNAAMFYNEVEDMQREINAPDGLAGVTQRIVNSADASIFGIEVDGTFAITDTLLAIASVGWIDAEYTEVYFDLDGVDGVTNADKALDLPRAAEWTYTLGLNHELDLGEWGYVSSRINYAFRDDAAYTDSNKGYLLEQEILDIGADFHTDDGRWVFGIYGRNMLNDVKHGGDTQLPASVGGGTFAPLAKGRVMGAEVTYNFF